MTDKERSQLLMAAVQQLMELYKDLCDTEAERRRIAEEVKKTHMAI